MPDPKYFWQVEMPNGDILEVKDKVAREAIAGGVSYIGKLWIGSGSEHMTDGDTRTSVYIADSTQQSGYRVVTAMAGNLVLDEGETAGNPSNEFIFDGTNWQEFGHESLGDLGDFAFVDEGRVTVLNDVTYTDPTPAHTSTAATVNITENNSGNLAITGTFTQPSFSQSVTLTGTSTHGTTSTTLDVDATETVPSGKTGYTPAGTVGAPTISLDSAGSTTTIKNPTSKTVVTGVSASTSSLTANKPLYLVITPAEGTFGKITSPYFIQDILTNGVTGVVYVRIGWMRNSYYCDLEPENKAYIKWINPDDNTDVRILPWVPSTFNAAQIGKRSTVEGYDTIYTNETPTWTTVSGCSAVTNNAALSWTADKTNRILTSAAFGKYGMAMVRITSSVNPVYNRIKVEKIDG